MRCSLLALLAFPLAAVAQNMHIPERVLILSGDSAQAHEEVLAVLYDSKEFQFHDAKNPRFLFLDTQGRAALGIGGALYATVGYGFDGSPGGDANFITYDIPVPGDAARRSDLSFSANHSKLFLHLAGHARRIGTYQMYMQAAFSGPGGYGFTLKQAYISAANVTAGLALSTFCDPAGPATVDTQGPSGVISKKNVLVRYAPSLSPHVKAGIAIEQPSVSITHSENTAQIAQRVPDIPFYVQYGWRGGHVRASGIVRNMSYRDLAEGRNRLTAGYGASLSAVVDPTAALQLYGNVSWGRGIATYVNDLGGYGLDLVPSATPGILYAPASWQYDVSAQYDFTRRLFVAASWSQVRLYDAGQMAGDTYRSASYLSVNAFYTPFDDCQLGLAYIRGLRADQDRQSATANRLMASVRYSF